MVLMATIDHRDKEIVQQCNTSSYGEESDLNKKTVRDNISAMSQIDIDTDQAQDSWPEPATSCNIARLLPRPSQDFIPIVVLLWLIAPSTSMSISVFIRYVAFKT